MKIVIPVTGFGKSGGFRVLSELANNWIRSGHDVMFISHVKSIPVYFPTTAKILWIDNSGNECDFQEKSKEYLTQKGIIQFLLTLNSLRIALNKFCDGYDIVLANHSFSSYPVYFSRFKGKKWYYIQAYEPEYYAMSKGFKNIFFYCLSYLSYYLPIEKIVNSHIYCNYKNIKTDKVVYPGLDLKIFYSKKDIGKFNNPLRLGIIGRKEIFKGTKYAYDAFEKLRTNLDAELWVAFGDSEVEDKNIKDFQPKSDLELGDFYRNIDILIASGTVQLGAVHYPVIEAMSCGTPVITTAYYPADNTNAWIVPIHNSNSIVKSVLDIIENESINDKVLRSLSEVKQFEWEGVALKMIGEFENLEILNKNDQKSIS